MSGKKYAVVYTPEASEDLNDIYSYIAFSLRERKIAVRITQYIVTVVVTIQSPRKMEDDSKHSSKCQVEKRVTCQEIAKGLR